MDELLRIEARPRSASELTRTQIDALERILDVLAAAVDDLPSQGTGHRDDLASKSLDEQRKSRIFFLSGEAGTGKTTVYLWLRKYASRITKKKDLDEELQSLQEAGGKQGSIATQLKELRPGLVWLEPLALEEVANAATNYLAAILARIDQVLTDKLGTDSGGAASSSDRLGFDRPGMTEALTEFERLRTDIGLAWDGNLPQRGEHIDPDVFAEEVMRAEGARIRINRRFHEVLERLTERIYQRDENPLFVLPVDDLSLNPGPSLEILRLLRMISVPRLFILALGDESTFEELGFQKILGEHICLAGKEAFKVDRQERVLMARARDLSFQAQRKLIPPGQRAVLEALHWDEALKQIGVRRDSTNGPQRQPLWESLQDRKLKNLIVPSRSETRRAASHDDDHTTAEWGLLEFLAFPGESKIALKDLCNPSRSRPRVKKLHDLFQEPEGIEDAYTGLQILEVPVRHAIDLWLGMPKVVNEKNGNKDGQKSESRPRLVRQRERVEQNRFFGWIRGETLRHLNEQNYMSNADRERCEDAIRLSWYTSASLNTQDLKVLPDYDSGFTSNDWRGNRSTSGVSEIVRSQAVIEVRPHRRWRLGPRGALDRQQQGRGQVGTWSYMPPRPLAWFVLLHDLLVFTKGQGLQGPPLPPRWNEHQWAGTRWSTSLLERQMEATSLPEGQMGATSGFKRGNDDPFFLPWPLPEWQSFWQFDCFLAAWNAVVDHASAELERLNDGSDAESGSDQRCVADFLAYWWIRLAVDVFFPDGRIQRVFEEKEKKDSKKKDIQCENQIDKEYALQGEDGRRETAWMELTCALKCLEEKTRGPYYHYYRPARPWIRRLALLACPEYGLPMRTVRHILTGPIRCLLEYDTTKGAIEAERCSVFREIFSALDTLDRRGGWEKMARDARIKMRNLVQDPLTVKRLADLQREPSNDGAKREAGGSAPSDESLDS